MPVVPEWFGVSDIGQDDCKKAIFSQARRYHFASLQDRNPVVAIRHNGYAVGLIGLLKDISDEAEVKELTGESLRQLWLEATTFQDRMEAGAFKALDELQKRGVKLPF